MIIVRSKLNDPSFGLSKTKSRIIFEEVTTARNLLKALRLKTTHTDCLLRNFPSDRIGKTWVEVDGVELTDNECLTIVDELQSKIKIFNSPLINAAMTIESIRRLRQDKTGCRYMEREYVMSSASHYVLYGD